MDRWTEVMEKVLDGVLVLAWFCGTISGALWGAAMEHKEQESARLFGRMMVFFYSLGFLAIVLTSGR